MHIITRKRLLDFGAKHPAALGQLLDWERLVRRKSYKNTAEVSADFPSVDFIGDGRAVFNIRGNAYRLVVGMAFKGRGTVWIRHVVTHREYDLLMKRSGL
ncbi:MAG: type II toxin-antitoxin system HigB family toxin [Gemmatimonadaceae bacterium]